MELLVINAAECEPYISCDEALMCTRPVEIIEGIRIMRHALHARQVVIGIEDNKQQDIAADVVVPGTDATNTVTIQSQSGNPADVTIFHAAAGAGDTGDNGTGGSVAYQFRKTGIISYPGGSDEDAVMEAALEVGAEDVVGNDDGSVDVYTTPEEFEDVKPGWAPYVAVADLSATTTKVKDFGGTVVFRTEHPAEGAVALILDPTGAALFLYQIGSHEENSK